MLTIAFGDSTEAKDEEGLGYMIIVLLEIEFYDVCFKLVYFIIHSIYSTVIINTENGLQQIIVFIAIPQVNSWNWVTFLCLLHL